MLTRLAYWWPVLVYAVAWTTILTLTVAVASFPLKVAFVSAISSSSSFSKTCVTEGFVRVPLDSPAGEMFCFPAHLLGKSKFDLILPTVFAAVVVGWSACLVRAVGLWEADPVH